MNFYRSNSGKIKIATLIPGLIAVALGFVVAYTNLLPPPAPQVPEAQAAITLDGAATSATSGGSSVTSLSWSHTVSGTNRLLIVSVGEATTAGRNVTSVTYAGQALTLLATTGASNHGHDVSMWHLVNPSTGTNSVVVSAGSAQFLAGGSISFTGVNQSTPFGTAVTASSGGTHVSSISVNVSSASGELVVDAATTYGDTLSVGVGQTQRYNVISGTTVRIAGSTEPGATTVTMSWSLPITESATIIAVPIKPAPAVAAPTVTTLDATSVTATTATLNGSANPNGAATNGWFRWGTSNVACGSLPTVTTSQALGSGTTAVAYSQGLTGLTANTTYWFCAQASNSGGTSSGSVLSFPTLGPPDATAITTSPTDGGRVGQTVTVTGSNFGSGPCNGTTFAIKISGIADDCVGVSWSNTSISFTVDMLTGTYGGTGAFVIRANDLDDSTPLTFFVYPDITLVTPPLVTNAAREGDSITLNGNHFGTTGTVSILGQTATGCTYADTSVTCSVPAAIADTLYTGDIVLTRTTPADSKTDTFSGFRILPKIASLTPASGGVGASVTIAGDHFCGTGTCPLAGSRSTASYNVKFNGLQVVDADVTGWSDTQIAAKVPTGATTGPLTVNGGDPAWISNGVTFTISAEKVTAYICKDGPDPDFNTTTLTCLNGAWKTLTTPTASDPVTVSCAPPDCPATTGSYFYWAYVCDDGTPPLCSSGSFGSFSIGAAPNTPATPTCAPSSMIAGSQTSCSTSATDPNTPPRQVKYLFDCNEDSLTDVSTGLVASGTSASASCTMGCPAAPPCTRQVKAKAENDLGIQSGWSLTSAVSVTLNPAPGQTTLLSPLRACTASLSNGSNFRVTISTGPQRTLISTGTFEQIKRAIQVSF